MERFRGLGWALVAFGVLAVRLPGNALPVPARLLLPTSDVPFLGGVPPNFGVGLLVILAGVALLATGSSRASEAPDPDGGGPTLSRADLAVLVLVPVVTVGFFAAFRERLERGDPVMVAALFGPIFVTLAWLLHRDRREGRVLSVTTTRAERLLLPLGGALLLVFYASAFTSWKFSCVGDEGAFLELAEDIGKQKLSVIPLLSGSGVYGTMPVAVSSVQALALPLLEPAAAGWRLSDALFTLLNLVPLYLVARHLFRGATPAPRLLAALTCVLFFFSELTVVWARTGKPHAAFLPPVTFGLALFLAGQARRSRLLVFASGLAAGLGGHLGSLATLAALGTLASVLAAWAVADGPRLRRVLHSGALVASGVAVSSAALLVQVEYWRRIVGQNLVSDEAVSTRALAIPRTLEALLMFLTFDARSHFLVGDTVDPLLAVLVVGGLASFRLLGPRVWLGITGVLVALSVISGGLAHYGHAPVTRVFLLMLPLSLLAGAGLAALTRSLGPFMRTLVASLVVALSASYSVAKLELWNGYQAGATPHAYELRRIQEGPSGRIHVLVPDREAGLLEGLIRQHGLSDRAVVLPSCAEAGRRLEGALRPLGPLADVRIGSSCENAARLEAIVRENGSALGPPLGERVPVGPVRNTWAYSLFGLLNPER